MVARLGWIIPEPFAIPPTVNSALRETAVFGMRVGGEDRLGSVGAAVRGERSGRVVEPREHALHRQRRADHAGREDDHLLRREPEQRGGMLGRRDCVGDPLLAGRGVRDAGVDHDRLRLRLLEVLLGDDDRRRQHAVLRPHRRAGRRRQRPHEREVALLLADLRAHAGGDEARRPR